MGNSNVLSAATVLVLLFSISASMPTSIQHGGTIQSLYHLGRIEGKTFYIDRPRTDRNWMEAKAFCEQANLLLASITTPKQEIFIRDAVANLPDIGEASWTAGRTRRSQTQFVFDSPPQPVFNTSQQFSYGLPAHQGCLRFVHKGPVWDALPCSHTNGVLCESIE